MSIAKTQAPTNSQRETDEINSLVTPPLLVLSIVTAIAVAFGLWLALGYAGTDIEQGDVQRLFYVHVPSFFGAFVAFIAAVVGGVGYLRTRNLMWDRLALAGVEVGLMLSLVNLATGSIWARPIWNTWWTWDSRLTSAAVMALTYAAYLMLRAGVENPEQRRRFAAVYGIIAIVTALATLFIIRIDPTTIHPVAVGASPQNAEGTFELDATRGVTTAILANMPIWTLLVPMTLMWWRMRLERINERVERMKAALLGS